MLRRKKNKEAMVKEKEEKEGVGTAVSMKSKKTRKVTETIRKSDESNDGTSSPDVRTPHRAKRSVLSLISFLLLAIVGGVIGVWYASQDSPNNDSNAGNSALSSEENTSSTSPSEPTLSTPENESSSSSSHKPLRSYAHYAILQELPHDPKAFTQGLTFGNGKLWEGTGMHGQSELRHVDPVTGTVLAKHALQDTFFGEGIAYFEVPENSEALIPEESATTTTLTRRRLIQLTWQEKTGWIYDADTLDVLQTFSYETVTGQGWGITYHPGRHEFIVTDGSEFIMFWDATTLQEKKSKRLRVMYTPLNVNNAKPGPVRHLNEIEYIPDTNVLLANVWYRDILVQIDIDTGTVTQIYDFRDLYVNRKDGVDCFNGISVTDEPGELWVTGKLWPTMYRVKLLV